jgi:hypothetical protein
MLRQVYSGPRNCELVAAERAENRPSAEALVAKSNRGRIADRVAALAGARGQQFPSLGYDEAVDRMLARNPALADAYQREQCGPDRCRHVVGPAHGGWP